MYVGFAPCLQVVNVRGRPISTRPRVPDSMIAQWAWVRGAQKRAGPSPGRPAARPRARSRNSLPAKYFEVTLFCQADSEEPALHDSDAPAASSLSFQGHSHTRNLKARYSLSKDGCIHLAGRAGNHYSTAVQHYKGLLCVQTKPSPALAMVRICTSPDAVHMPPRLRAHGGVSPGTRRIGPGPQCQSPSLLRLPRQHVMITLAKQRDWATAPVTRHTCERQQLLTTSGWLFLVSSAQSIKKKGMGQQL